MPTAMTFDDQQRLIFTSLKGHVYRLNESAEPKHVLELTTLHEGLAAPFGVMWIAGDGAGSLHARLPMALVAHKPELIALHLTPKDEVFVRGIFASGWGLTDDYHDWTSGIARDSKGNLFIGLASDYTFKNRPKEKSKWRGDILRIDPAGKIESIARGLRYPTGLAVDDQDRLFVSDQQGVQNTFNELNYIQPGHRYGVPSRHEPEPNAPANPPAVQIPHPWTRSVNGIVFVAGKSRVSSVESRRRMRRRVGLLLRLSTLVSRLHRRPVPRLRVQQQHARADERARRGWCRAGSRLSVQQADGRVGSALRRFSETADAAGCVEFHRADLRGHQSGW